MKNVLKGFIIGVGKIMPGVSGAMLAMNLGVYEKAIYCISSFFKKPYQSLKYLLPIICGILLAIVSMSKVIKYFLHANYLATMLLFIGLIIGSYKSFVKQLKKAHKFHYIVMTISFLLVLLMHNLKTNINIHSYFLIGFVDAVTMIIPGLCGSAIMMLLGIYNNYLDLLSNLTNFAYLKYIIIYFMSLVITILLVSKIMSYYFTKSRYLHFIIFGLSTASLVTLFMETLNGSYTFKEILIAYIFLLIGYYIGNIFDN